MNESINLIEILKDAPIGIELYSPICGTVLFCSIGDDFIEVSVKNYPSSEPHKFLFDIHGVSYGEYGECLLFPSKDNRDWSTFKAPRKHKHFEPFEKVLVKSYDAENAKDIWIPSLYGCYVSESKKHCSVAGVWYKDDEILAYKGNEDKLGKPVKV